MAHGISQACTSPLPIKSHLPRTGCTKKQVTDNWGVRGFACLCAQYAPVHHTRNNKWQGVGLHGDALACARPLKTHLPHSPPLPSCGENARTNKPPRIGMHEDSLACARNMCGPHPPHITLSGTNIEKTSDATGFASLCPQRAPTQNTPPSSPLPSLTGMHAETQPP